ncbi:Hydroxyethylthiazole kinase family-domain-containing protein [Halteromyces radiatus]|uniref:Hydroxyethylthiazole kinase family-domain-containing protein n=1 Tax=Halteromyces radiatus TaxID=101107 RepID=UPI00221EA1A5|nr:Hydroxyethylthiazole kinase family-domain-containing protein [Halteromyces radiatus]KAI8086462.1 Hydroxyethylthiazole kinase family-domain-containing protein [Halteromyces radiatus]
MANHKCVDYSLYLVTDSSLVPSNTTLLDQIEKALEGGVTLVQLREKDMDTGPFIDLANKVKTLTRRYNVPFIINDRLDVALAVDADGVHIGQDDMPMTEARKLLGHGKIIGVSCNNEQEAKKAVEEGADYIGIGAVWFTSTKELKKQPLGVDGVRRILESIDGYKGYSVAIGGINLNNAEELLLGGRPKSGSYTLDGLAIVSAIIGAADPKTVCQNFTSILQSTNTKQGLAVRNTVTHILEQWNQSIKNIHTTTPMVHHITNNVVINDNANATLAIGASPIMSTNRVEMEELAKVNGAMVLNMGTLNDIDTMILAAQVNNRHGNPVVLDPVGCGATTFRKQTVQRFLNEARMTIIKGNGGEILSMANRGGRSRGVDSLGNVDEKIAILAVKELAQQHQCIVAMTGPIDYISDGVRTYAIENGDPMLACITGSGCMVTSVVACFAAANRLDYLMATIMGILVVNIASELAMQRKDVHGPGTFRSALIDELYNITHKTPNVLQQRAKIRFLS